MSNHDSVCIHVCINCMIILSPGRIRDSRTYQLTVAVRKHSHVVEARVSTKIREYSETDHSP